MRFLFYCQNVEPKLFCFYFLDTIVDRVDRVPPWTDGDVPRANGLYRDRVNVVARRQIAAVAGCDGAVT